MLKWKLLCNVYGNDIGKILKEAILVGILKESSVKVMDFFGDE